MREIAARRQQRLPQVPHSRASLGSTPAPTALALPTLRATLHVMARETVRMDQMRHSAPLRRPRRCQYASPIRDAWRANTLCWQQRLRLRYHLRYRQPVGHALPAWHRLQHSAAQVLRWSHSTALQEDPSLPLAYPQHLPSHPRYDQRVLRFHLMCVFPRAVPSTKYPSRG